MALSPVSRGSYDPSYARSSQAGSLTSGLTTPGKRSTEPAQASPFGFDKATNKVWVNGVVFDADDHDTALSSREALKEPMRPMPGNFRPMGIDEYGGYIDRIKNPSLGRLMSKNFGIGVDQSQQLVGGVLKFLGAEDTGQSIIDQQNEDMRFNQPYQRQFTDIDSTGGAGEWFAANAAQMAPLMAELIITTLATGGAGGAAAAGSATGAKLLARGATRTLASDAARGLEMLRRGEKVARASAEGKALRAAGQVAGARFGGIAASEGVAIGDIYQAVEESGRYDSPTMARLATLFASVPYAASEYLPAAAAVKRAFSRSGKDVLTKSGRAKRLAKKLGTGAAVGAGVEGSTEAFQDMLSLGVSGQLDFNDPEVRNQLINAFAAGAGIGVGVGGVANLMSRTQPDAIPERAPLDTDQPDLDILDRSGQQEMFDPLEMNRQGELFRDEEMGPGAVPARPEITETNPGQMDLFNPTPETTSTNQPTDTYRQLDLFDIEGGRTEPEIGNVEDKQAEQEARGIFPLPVGQEGTPAPYIGDATTQQAAAPLPGTYVSEERRVAPFNPALQEGLEPLARQQQIAEQARLYAQQQTQLRQRDFELAQQQAIDQRSQEVEMEALAAQDQAAAQQIPQLELPFVGKVGQYGDLERKSGQQVDLRQAVINSLERVNALEALRQCLVSAK